jgi:hypothetical protein
MGSEGWNAGEPPKQAGLAATDELIGGDSGEAGRFPSRQTMVRALLTMPKIQVSHQAERD